MATKRHILIVSGSRADYGLLYWPTRLLLAEPDLMVSIAVTGMHLSADFGNTVDQFAQDGFPVTVRVPVLSNDDSNAEMALAIGRGITGFVDVLSRLQPDLMFVLGDRFEIFAAVQAAFVMRIPVAHLCGGDVTNGALDDGFRHAISKMASLHFVTSTAAASRVRQLGEAPERIVMVGSPGIDFIIRTTFLDRETLAHELGHELPDRFILATFHPVTLDPIPTADQFAALLAALALAPPDIGIVFTFANADADGAQINEMILDFVQRRPLTYAYKSLGQRRFLSLMRLAGAMVGNSSSGLYEAPSFSVPTVNIGRRQEGRLRAASVIDCPPDRAAIALAIDKALALRLQNVVNPYGDGSASERIVATLLGIPDWGSLIYKEFQDLASA